MPDKAVGNIYRTTLVCIDERQKGSFSGRFYNAYLTGGAVFEGVLDLLTQMDDLLNQMRLPQSFTAKRTFKPASAEAHRAPGIELQQGRLATFEVKVIFRQNASWQGTVVWSETGQEESFRSVLELLLLMDSAVPKEGPVKAVPL